eukprot:1275420-Amorphochlora_amoeboformis.AAC.1
MNALDEVTYRLTLKFDSGVPNGKTVSISLKHNRNRPVHFHASSKEQGKKKGEQDEVKHSSEHACRVRGGKVPYMGFGLFLLASKLDLDIRVLLSEHLRLA